MPYRLSSTRTFDKRLGALLAKLEERDGEIRKSLKAIVARLMSGDFSQAKLHHPNLDETRCVPLIDDQVVVFRVIEDRSAQRSILLLTVEED